MIEVAMQVMSVILISFLVIIALAITVAIVCSIDVLIRILREEIDNEN